MKIAALNVSIFTSIKVYTITNRKQALCGGITNKWWGRTKKDTAGMQIREGLKSASAARRAFVAVLLGALEVARKLVV